MVGLVGVELISDVALKYAANGFGGLFLALGLAGYALVGYLVYATQGTGRLWGISNTSWNALNTLATAVVFAIVFNETYSTSQWVGIALVTLGLIILGR